MRDRQIIPVKRDVSLDGAAALMMIVTILHHAGIFLNYPLSVMHIFNFFMPWFFFKAGYLYRRTAKGVSIFRKYFHRYIIPILFLIFLRVIEKLAWIHVLGIQDDNFHYIPGIIWFIETLLICRIIFDVLPKENIIWVIAISTFILADFINREELNLPLIMREIPMGLFYMSMGSLYKDMKTMGKVNNDLAIVGMFLLYVLFLVVMPSAVDMRMGRIVFGLYEISVIGNIVGILLLNKIMKRFECYIPRCFSFIGKESMSFYILHMSILSVTSVVCYHFNIGGTTFKIISALVVFVTVPLIIAFLERIKMDWLLGR